MLCLTQNSGQALEVAATVRKTLALEVVAALRTRLVPEFNVYSSSEVDGTLQVRTGIVDAIAYNDAGEPEVVVDWKSDVNPSPEATAHYTAQVRAYLQMTGTPKGYVVFATTGAIHEVAPG